MPAPPAPHSLAEVDLDVLLETLVDGVVVLGPDGRVQRINGEGCRLLEISSEAAAGRSLIDLLGPSDPLARLAAHVLDTRRPAVQDGLSLERRHTGHIELSASLSPLVLPETDAGNAGAGGLIAILRDRTNFNSLRDQITNEERLASYGHIAAGIAHEVKNPLGGIRGAAELLAQRTRDDDRAARMADMIVREVDRITGLVEDLMVFAKGETLDVVPVNVHRLLDDVIQNVELDADAPSIRFDRAFDPSIPEIDADPARLTQVFLNLVRNAVQAIDERDAKAADTVSDVAFIEITTRMPVEHRLAGADGRPIPTVQVSVRDTGPGIEPDVLARLATPFFTTKPKGTGLGLAVSRHWVNQHGGRLHIESKPGEGTVVHVELPLRALVSTLAAATEETDVGSPRSIHHGV